MYEELIEGLHPKPQFNLNWYENEDLYSEGDVEDIIIQLIAENEPENYTQAISEHYNWSTFYHLTHGRKNIINWYPFSKDSEVLEIGCGMGAITGSLCEYCGKVTAVELSQRRALATLLRCREKENLEIIVGNLNDIEFDRKFDYITLIGVLEYQGSYTTSENPYKDFLKKVKTLLKPAGKLLIAIENQYGLKYWCGAREDHTGIPFEGMNQYRLSDRKVRTFSKNALDMLIKESGFSSTYFYYPMPDYKLPTVIYSQDFLPSNSNMMNLECYYIPDESSLVAQENDIYKDIIQNGVFDFFANSFLVECSETGTVGEASFASISDRRMPEYRGVTRINSNGKVEKFALDNKIGFRHISQILKNEKELKAQGVNIIESIWKDERLISDFMSAPTCEELLLSAYQQKDKPQIYEMWDMLLNEILNSSEKVPWEENILYSFEELQIKPNKEAYGEILRTGYLDMILRNAFYKDYSFYWFDQEWILENTPSKYILYRAVKEFYFSFPESREVIPLEDLVRHYDMIQGWKEFQLLEELFLGGIMDRDYLKQRTGFHGNNAVKHIYNNINKIIG